MTSIHSYSDEIKKLKIVLKEADAVLIGAGSGLSTSAGFVYEGKRFEKYFPDFIEEYGLRDMYSGGFAVYDLPPEKMWAYWSRYVYINRYMDPPKPVYSKLYDLVKEKDHFVLTTNVDHCFQKAGFDKNRIFYTQGDYGLFQCSKPCHRKTYDNEEAIRKMILSQGFTIREDGDLSVAEGMQLKMEVPKELIPVCPVCGEPMMMNLRADDRFVQDEGWDRAAERYYEFLRRHQGLKVLLLECGVGGNTPGIIKYPFWKMTHEEPGFTYACLNYSEAFAPDQIAARSICIKGDIGQILKDLNETE